MARPGREKVRRGRIRHLYLVPGSMALGVGDDFLLLLVLGVVDGVGDILNGARHHLVSVGDG